MKPVLRSFASSRWVRVLLICALIVTMIVAVFDWNWFRGPVQRYLAEHSKREVKIDELHVRPSLQPTIRLRGVYIENAPWAAKRPFIKAGEVSFTVSLKSIWEGRPVISRLVLIDADVDMERQADGLRNWRLQDPEDRTPGTLRVQTLEAHRTQLRFVNRAIDLDFTARAEAAAAEPAGDAREQKNTTTAQSTTRLRDPLMTRITYSGIYEGASFSGETLSAGLMSFRESGVAFPLRGHLVSRKTRVDFDGFFTDVFDLGPMDAKIRVEGPTLAYVHPFLRIQPPPSRPFEFDAQLNQTAHIYRFTHLRGRLGDTDLTGEATYDRSGERPRVSAVLSSRRADIVDLAALVGLRYGSGATTKTTRDSAAASNADENDSDKPEAGRLLPTRAFRLDRLKTVDVHVTLEAKKLKAEHIEALESLRLTGNLAGGVLELKPVDLGFAGGHLLGSISFDAGREPHAARAAVEIRDVRLERLVPALAANARNAAPLRGEVTLTSRGISIASLFANASGSLSATLDGGSMSNLADAKLGLNMGKVLSLTVRGDRDVAIQCGAVRLDVRDGIARSRTLVLDTEQTRTIGEGSIDLRKERWDVLLTPQPKHPGLLTRRASIRAQGSFRTVHVSLQDRVTLNEVNARSCAAPESSVNAAQDRGRPGR